ncbi:ABC transporter permease [Anaerococcus murdochii]|uniref:ABC transporter permease n=1 Tax=Anaerococcus murdochii TaxID=411577 RepID=A0ABS7SWN3_9FIRM|nr:ABC transporter permease [Anaerococcus murdochii]MBZ2385943.1 ABC transporter permease [Anaerococcus murdochii]
MKLTKRLALDGIRKNKEVYLPYILIYGFMVFSFTSILLLMNADTLKDFYAMSSIYYILKIAIYVMGIFSLIFLYYSDGFLLNKRLKEISLYAILGLDKKHLSKILALESLIISALGYLIGIISASVIYKLLETIFLKLMLMEGNFYLSFARDAYIISFLVFAGISLLILLTRIIKIKRKSILDLFKEEKTFKRPRGMVLSAFVSLILLGSGYYLAQTINNPLRALSYFFLAVILVMIGTFFLFSSLSIVILKMMKASKSYYKTEKFISVSSLIFRLRSNAKGLGSITIMSTAAIILLSSAIALYRSVEDVGSRQYPRDVGLASVDEYSIDQVKKIIKENNLEAKNIQDYKAVLAFEKDGQNIKTSDQSYAFKNPNDLDGKAMGILVEVNDESIPEASNLKDGEFLLYKSPKLADLSELDINGQKLRKKSDIKDFPYKNSGNNSIVSYMFDFYYVIVKNLDKNLIIDDNKIVHAYNFDLSDEDMAIFKEKTKEVQNEFGIGFHDDFVLEGYKLYGAIFFVGIFLGLIFMVATGLIIYYKQIQEGFADKNKYESLRKLGIGEEKIKKTIDKQVLVFFFLPLVVSGIHVGFAFKMISKIFVMLGCVNNSIKITSFVIGFVIFALLYLIYYKLSSREYYKLIS